MSITKQEVLDFFYRYHETVMIKKGDEKEQAKFFLHKDPQIILLCGADISLKKNHEIHQKLEDEKHYPIGEWWITPLCDKPEKVQACGSIYWEARLKGSNAFTKCIVRENIIVQRVDNGELKFTLLMNEYHHFLPDSAPLSFL